MRSTASLVYVYVYVYVYVAAFMKMQSNASLGCLPWMPDIGCTLLSWMDALLQHHDVGFLALKSSLTFNKFSSTFNVFTVQVQYLF